MKRQWQRTLDTYLNGALVYILGTLWPPQPGSLAPQRIGIIQLWGIGESILVLPALRAVQTMWPQSTLTVFTTDSVAPVFAGVAQQIVVLSPTPWGIARVAWRYGRQFDVVIDFEEYLYVATLLSFTLGRYRLGFATRGRERLMHESVPYNPNQHVVETHLDLVRQVGARVSRPQLKPLAIAAADRIVVERWRQRQGLADQPFIVVAPAVSEAAPYRQWPLDRMAAVVRHLAEKVSVAVVVLGGPHDQDTLQRVVQMASVGVAVNHFSLPQAACLIAQAAVFIGSDSGLMHVSATMGTPTVGLFGPNTPRRFGPFGARHVALYHPVPGSPFINVHLGQVPDVCPREGQATQCGMLLISVAEVIQAATQLYSQRAV